MLVHFEEASSNRLDLATISVLVELTGGGGVQGARESSGKLAGWRAGQPSVSRAG